MEEPYPTLLARMEEPYPIPLALLNDLLSYEMFHTNRHLKAQPEAHSMLCYTRGPICYAWREPIPPHLLRSEGPYPTLLASLRKALSYLTRFARKEHALPYEMFHTDTHLHYHYIDYYH